MKDAAITDRIDALSQGVERIVDRAFFHARPTEVDPDFGWMGRDTPDTANKMLRSVPLVRPRLFGEIHTARRSRGK